MNINHGSEKHTFGNSCVISNNIQYLLVVTGRYKNRHLKVTTFFTVAIFSTKAREHMVWERVHVK